MITEKANCRGRATRRLHARAALFALCCLALPMIAWPAELTAPSGATLLDGVISGGGVYMGTGTHTVQSAVGQTAIGASMAPSNAIALHGWPGLNPKALEISGPTPATAYIYGSAQTFEAVAAGGDGNYTFTWEWDADGFGTGVAAEVLSAGTHPDGVTTVAITAPGAGVSQLSLTGIVQSADGEYRCTVADGSADPDAVSAAAYLAKRNPMSVDTAPATVQRKNYSEALTLTANVTGGFSPFTYQWARSTDGGSNWTDLVDGVSTYVRPGIDPGSGGTTVSIDVTTAGSQGPVLTIDHPLYSIHSGLYRCTVTDDQYPSQSLPEGTTLDSSTVTVVDALALLESPSAMDLYEGNSAELGLTIVGGANPALNYTYTWSLNDPSSGEDLLISNSNINPYAFVADADPPVKVSPTSWAADAGSPGLYGVLISDTSLGSQNGVLRVGDIAVEVKPAVSIAITTPVAELTKNVTQTFTFNAVASGGYVDTGYTYIWTFNGTVLQDGQPHPSGSGALVSGATTDTLVVANIKVADAGDYKVQVIDSKGDALTPSDPCPLDNGLCSASDQVTTQVTNNLIVLDQPESFSVYDGDTVIYEVTVGGGDPNSYSFTWSFRTEDNIGPITIPIAGPQPLSQTGSSVQITFVPPDTSRLTVSNVGVEVLPTMRGDDGAYTCTASDSVSGNLPDTSDEGLLEVFLPVSILSQPEAVTTYEGRAASFAVQASGGINDSRSFQWQVDTGSGFADIGGETAAVLALSSVALADDGNRYRCVVTAPESDVATALANYEQISASATLNVSVPVTVQQPLPSPVRVYVDEAPFALRALFEGGSPVGGSLATGYTAEWLRTGISPVAPEVSVGAGTFVLPTPQTPEITALFTVVPAAVPVGLHDYRVEITDEVQTTSSAAASVEVANKMSFDQPLEDVFARVGDRVTWEISVSGGFAPLTYSWDRLIDDGTKAQVWTPVGGNAPVLVLNNLDYPDAGMYRVTVSDALGSQVGPSEAELFIENALPVGGGLGLAALALLSALGGAMAVRRREGRMAK